MLQKSYDFLGVNYYTAFFASNVMFYNNVNISVTTDNHANLTCKPKYVPLGPVWRCFGFQFFSFLMIIFRSSIQVFNFSVPLVERI